METRVGEILFLDTNILLTATDRSRHELARRLLSLSQRAGIHLAVSGQIIREYLVVATRPVDANGLGLSASDALKNVGEFRRRTLFFDETESVSRRLGLLISECGTTGKGIHDANVAATMLTHGISRLVTQNRDEFGSRCGSRRRERLAPPVREPVGGCLRSRAAAYLERAPARRRTRALGVRPVGLSVRAALVNADPPPAADLARCAAGRHALPRQ